MSQNPTYLWLLITVLLKQAINQTKLQAKQSFIYLVCDNMSLKGQKGSDMDLTLNPRLERIL